MKVYELGYLGGAVVVDELFLEFLSAGVVLDGRRFTELGGIEVKA